MYRTTILCVALVLLALGPLAAQRMPPDSRPRAEQHAAWRASLNDADRALAEGRIAEAEATLSSVIEQARKVNTNM